MAQNPACGKINQIRNWIIMVNKQTFENRVAWRQGKTGVTQIGGRPDIEIATPPGFDGPDGYWSPEDMFLASINACLMTTFLYFAERSGISFESYESGIRGDVELVDGKFVFTRITVTPQVIIADESIRQKVGVTLNRSKKYCLISASVKTPITVDSNIVLETSCNDEEYHETVL
jgi:organic hydroperoxide reductase OsmC/OhrA